MSQYFPQDSWNTQPGRVMHANTHTVPQEQGGSLLGTLGTIASMVAGFGVGGPMLAGAANAAQTLGGMGQGAVQGAQSAAVDTSAGGGGDTKSSDDIAKKNDIKDKQPEQTEIKTEPVGGEGAQNMFNPQQAMGGPQDWILQLLMQGLMGNQGQVPYSSQTNFERGY